MHCSEMGGDTSSVWNFCARFLDVISGGNQWWRHKMSAVFSGYVRIYSVPNATLFVVKKTVYRVVID